MNIVRAVTTDAHYIIQGTKTMIRFALPEGMDVFNVTARICPMTRQLILNADVNYLPPSYKSDGTSSSQANGRYAGTGVASGTVEYR